MSHNALTSRRFDFSQLKRSHVAEQCVCCGSLSLQSAPAILMPFVAHRTFGWAPALIDESWGLNTVPRGMAYSVCKSLLCADCGLLFSDIRFSDDELGKLYDDYRGHAYTTLRETYEPGYTLRNDALAQAVVYGGIIEKFLAPHLRLPVSILDWGGDSGKNTPFKNQTTSLDIFDISHIEVIEGARAVTRQEALAKQYDLVVCSNVLEHVPYPSDLLQDIQQTMHADSVLYLEVPFEEVVRLHGREALGHKRHWHEHVNFFSPEAMQGLVENCGLRVVATNADASITAGLKSSYIMQMACKLA
jgi:hypothetical protein